MKPMRDRDPELWEDFAVCGDNPEMMYVEGAEQNNIKRRTCQKCLAQFACAVQALEQHEEFGVRGNMTERQRRALHRKLPDFPWRRALRVALVDEQRRRYDAVAAARQNGQDAGLAEVASSPRQTEPSVVKAVDTDQPSAITQVEAEVATEIAAA